ncbi:MAG: beta-1,3-glucanase family protein [Holophaga sp.]|nr:beta-1,3-glucanase family protein [Holophaga sp.]
MPRSPLAVLLAAVCLHCGGSSASPPGDRPVAKLGEAQAGLQLTLINASRGPAASTPVFATGTCLDAAGRFCRLDRSGRLLPCSTADNVRVKDGRTWCDYGIPLQSLQRLRLDPDQAMISGRLYLSAGTPLYLRVDEATGGLVQPDPANPTDPNRAIRFDWIEFTLDGSGFHGNTTCVDQFGLPIALTVFDRTRQRPLGPVGLTESRTALFAAYRASVPPAFQALADPQDCRILAPAHGAFSAAGPEKDYLQGYIDQMWTKYRSEPLVLTPDQGRFTGTVDDQDRILFARAGGGATCAIQGKPTSQEVFLCNGVLAQGNDLEKVLGAQIAAMLNRHVLEAPLAWRRAAGYYRQEPCNSYAWFWHQHGLGRKAYGFAYDDVNDQSASLAAPAPREIRIVYRLD